MHNLEKTMQKGLVISLMLHLIAGLGLYLSQFELTTLPSTRFIEVINYGVQQPKESGSNISKPTGLKEPMQGSSTGAATNTAPDNINLPKASSQSPEEIISPTGEKVAWSSVESSAKIGNTTSEITSGLTETAVSPLPAPESEKVSVKANADFLADLRQRLAAEDTQSGGYTLSGEIVSRKILNKVIPEYPAGIQQDIEVQLRFEVLPDGKVKDSIVIIKKGGPLMDAASLEALKQWRFNTISTDMIQTGVITFRYELE
ncbi:MAG: TonB family protein [Candidatus Cloacimonetes bacterium]|nr:TonB family protein [Candidatus Cloacimonadota bacterium]